MIPRTGLLLPFVMLLGGAPALAGTQLRATPGWDGWYRPGRSVVVTAWVEHTGAPAAGRLELRDARGQLRAVRDVSLVDRTRRRIELVLTSPNLVASDASAGGDEARAAAWEVVLRVGGADIRRRLVWRPLVSDTRLVVTLGAPPRTFVPFVPGSRVVDVAADPSTLPRAWAAWDAVDVCLITAPGLDRVEASARRALRRWILAGGCAVAMLAPDPVPVLSLLPQIVPWRLTGRDTVLSRDLLGWCGVGADGEYEELTRLVGSPVPHAVPPGLTDEGASPLIARYDAGTGTVWTVHVDPSRVRELTGEGGRAFWARLLRLALRDPDRLRALTAELVGGEERRALPPLAGALTRLREGKPGPPGWWVALFVGLYGLALGGIGLRFAGARRLIAQAVASVVFCGLALTLRGLTPAAVPDEMSLTVLDASSTGQLVHRIDLHRSPQGSLAVAHDPVRTRVSAGGGQVAGTGVSEADGRLSATYGDPMIEGQRYVVTALTPEPGAPGIGGSYVEAGAEVALLLRNPFETPLRDAWLVTADGAFRIGVVRPGESHVTARRAALLPEWLARLEGRAARSVQDAVLLESFRRPQGGDRPRSAWDLTPMLRSASRRVAILVATFEPVADGVAVAPSNPARRRVGIVRLILESGS